MALWTSCGLRWVRLTIAASDYRCLIRPDVLTLALIPAGLGISYLLDPVRLAGRVGTVARFAVSASHLLIVNVHQLGEHVFKLFGFLANV